MSPARSHLGELPSGKGPSPRSTARPASGAAPTAARRARRGRRSRPRPSGRPRAGAGWGGAPIGCPSGSQPPDISYLRVSADTLPRRNGRWVGRPVERVEDARLLLGRGSFLADLRFPGALDAVFVRSPIAHGLIRSIDADAGAGAARCRRPHRGRPAARGARGSPADRGAPEDAAARPCARARPLRRRAGRAGARRRTAISPRTPRRSSPSSTALCRSSWTRRRRCSTAPRSSSPSSARNVVYRATRSSGDVDGAFGACRPRRPHPLPRQPPDSGAHGDARLRRELRCGPG